jgi:hypothetical protein
VRNPPRRIKVFWDSNFFGGGSPPNKFGGGTRNVGTPIQRSGTRRPHVKAGTHPAKSGVGHQPVINRATTGGCPYSMNKTRTGDVYKIIERRLAII